MFMVHVVFTCLWFMLNGLERFCHFFVGVFTQSPLPSSCLEFGGLQCSHIFIIPCVFYCFSFMVYFISWCLLMCYLFSFIFIYVHLFSFSSFLCSFLFIFFHVLLFFSLEKTITYLNHLHVDPRLSSADTWTFMSESNARQSIKEK